MSSYGLIYVLTANFIKVVHVVNIHLFSSLMSLTKIGRQEMPWKWNIYRVKRPLGNSKRSLEPYIFRDTI